MNDVPLFCALTPEQLARELCYRAAVSLADRLRTQEVFSAAEYRRIEQELQGKFSPVWGGITHQKA